MRKELREYADLLATDRPPAITITDLQKDGESYLNAARAVRDRIEQAVNIKTGQIDPTKITQEDIEALDELWNAISPVAKGAIVLASIINMIEMNNFKMKTIHQIIPTYPFPNG